MKRRLYEPRSNILTMEREELFQKRIEEFSNQAYFKGIAIFSDFLGLNELHMLKTHNFKKPGVSIQTFGGYEMAERQMAVFVPDALSYEWYFPIACIQIIPQSLKYTETLTHRDYLGAVLNLGIDRGKVGDILPNEQGAYLFCQEQMAEFIQNELSRVKHTDVTLSLVHNPTEVPSLKTLEIQGTVASVRLDAVLGLAFQASRSSMISFIEGGRVFVNGRMIQSNGYTLKEMDIISVRGKEKFRFDGILSKTKKDRYRILLQRYI